MNSAPGIDTKITLLAAGLIFLLALVLGVWKYRQIMAAEDHRAHPYVDIAHRAALLYSFATLLIAVFVELSAWPAWVNLTAAMVVVASARAEKGLASYYPGVGRADEMTCAHRTRPMGSLVTVSYRGRIIRCRVNDRGPFIKGRVIDISTSAARALGMMRSGIIRVSVE